MSVSTSSTAPLRKRRTRRKKKRMMKEWGREEGRKMTVGK